MGSIREELYGFRTRLGLSQNELARILECHPNTISRWEQGSSQPTAKYAVRLLRLATERGVDPPDLDDIGIDGNGQG